MKYLRWSENDLKYIAENAKDKNIIEWGKFFNVNEGVIIRVGIKFGLKFKDERIKKEWTENEVKYLKENAKINTCAEWARHFNVGQTIMRSKLISLDIKVMSVHAHKSKRGMKYKTSKSNPDAKTDIDYLEEKRDKLFEELKVKFCFDKYNEKNEITNQIINLRK